MKIWLGAATLFALSARGETADVSIGYQRVTDPRTPASYRLLGETEAARANLGRTMFGAHFTADTQPSLPTEADSGHFSTQSPVMRATTKERADKDPLVKARCQKRWSLNSSRDRPMPARRSLAIHS